MAVPQIDFNQQNKELLPEFRAAFERVVTSGQFILGNQVASFETALAQFCHAQHAIGLSSGTDALLVAMMALGIGAGDEVITTPFTFFGTAGSVARLGAKPVFVDIEPASFNLDSARLEAAITNRTKAVIPVHLFGQTADMKAIVKIARHRSIAVIEDACQSIGARDGDTPAGSIGDVGCLSFYPTKNLSAMGDAGACITNRPELNEKIRLLRAHGAPGEGPARYYHSFIGGNFRLDALQAAMLSIKLPHLDQWIVARRAHAHRYDETLAGLPMTLPIEAPGRFHVFNNYTVRIASGKRDALRHHLDAHGIGHGVYYPVPLHLQKCFEYLGYKPGDFPESERASSEVLSLPIYPEMKSTQQDEVIHVLREFFK